MSGVRFKGHEFMHREYFSVLFMISEWACLTHYKGDRMHYIMSYQAKKEKQKKRERKSRDSEFGLNRASRQPPSGSSCDKTWDLTRLSSIRLILNN